MSRATLLAFEPQESSVNKEARAPPPPPRLPPRPQGPAPPCASAGRVFAQGSWNSSAVLPLFAAPAPANIAAARATIASAESHASLVTFEAFTMYSFELGVMFPHVGCDPAVSGTAAVWPWTKNPVEPESLLWGDGAARLCLAAHPVPLGGSGDQGVGFVGLKDPCVTETN